MNDYIGILIWAAVILVIFGLAWRFGHIRRLSNYAAATREELKKCSWPSTQELKGSTMVVLVSMAMLSVFTLLIDLFIGWVVKLIT